MFSCLPMRRLPTSPQVANEQTANATASKSGFLEAFPGELQDMFVGHLDADSQASLGATNRHWQSMVARHLYPGRLSVTQAILEGRRHALGRLWDHEEKSEQDRDYLRDHDGMTPLMVAASTGDEAMLRCLMRHGLDDAEYPNNRRFRARYEPGPKDHYDLRAQDWARLTGHDAAFKNMLLSADPDGRARPCNDTSLDLHNVISAGHWTLTQTLLGPHFARPAGQLDSAAPERREGYRLEEPLSCRLLPLQCAAEHSPWHSPLLGLFRYHLGARDLPVDQLNQVVRRVDAGRGDWLKTLRDLIACGFDIKTSLLIEVFEAWRQQQQMPGANVGYPRSPYPESYLERWLSPRCFDLFSVTQLDAVCGGGILANSKAGHAILFHALRNARTFDDVAIDKQFPKRPLVAALVQRGVITNDEATHEFAEDLVTCFGIDAELWSLLESVGIDLDADAPELSLAQVVTYSAQAERSISSLVFLTGKGIDVQDIDSDPLNSVMRTLQFDPALHHDALNRFRAAGIALDRPGNLELWIPRAAVDSDSEDGVEERTLFAHTALESVLMNNNKVQAAWFLEHNVACSTEQMRAACLRLDEAQVPWPRAWFLRQLKKRRVAENSKLLLHVWALGRLFLS